jgi:WD40 repeat protein
MTLSPDGRRLVTWGKTYRAHQWDSASGKSLGAFFPSKVCLSDVAIAADNRTVLVGERGGLARLWDLPSGKPLSAPLPHAGEVYGALTASHLFVAAGPHVHVWRIPAPWPGTTPQVRQEIEALTHMSLDDADNLQVRP